MFCAYFSFYTVKCIQHIYAFFTISDCDVYCKNQRATQATDRNKSSKDYSDSSASTLLCLNYPPSLL